MVDISKVTYRLAEDKDNFFIEEMVLDLCELLNDEYDIEEVRKDLVVLRSVPNFVCYIAEDGHPIGCVAFLVAKDMGKKSYTAHECFWYVEPEYRKGVGKELVNFVEKDLICDRVEFGIANPSLLKLMERSGYSSIKTLMRKDL
jgi:hypothetical protein